jgi:hypothetical protein
MMMIRHRPTPVWRRRLIAPISLTDLTVSGDHKVVTALGGTLYHGLMKRTSLFMQMEWLISSSLNRKKALQIESWNQQQAW